MTAEYHLGAVFLGNPDPDLTNKIYNCTVLWVTPRSNYAVSIMIEE